MNKMLFVHILFFVLFLNKSAYADSVIIPAPPKVKASSYLLMDHDSGKYLVNENSGQKLPPASLTKIMTVYVVAEELRNGSVSLDDEVLVSEAAWRTQGSRMFIEVNEKVKLYDLVKGVVIQSGNDASVALAEHVSGTEDVFADLMNKYAERLGMVNTHFTNSTGLPDPDHYSTAWDLAILSRALINEHPDIYALHKIKEFTFNRIKQPNRNRLLWRDPDVDGIKTGHTEAAGFCLVASAIKNDMRLISVVMGTDSVNVREKASQALLNYGYRFYETHKLYSTGDVVTSVKVWKADEDMIELGVDHDLYITVPRGQYDKLEPVVEMEDRIIAPVNKGDRKATLNIMLGKEKLHSAPLSALQTISEGGIIKRLRDEIYLLFK